MGAVNTVTEIDHLLKENNIRNPGYFVFANTLNIVTVLEVLYNHGAEVFSKTK